MDAVAAAHGGDGGRSKASGASAFRSETSERGEEWKLHRLLPYATPQIQCYPYPMSTVAEIETALGQLPAAEREALEARLLARRFGLASLDENERAVLLASLDAAEREIDAGQDRQAESFAHAPEIGVSFPQRPGTRFLPYGSYLIIYRPDATRQTVRILRFWHGARRKRPLR